MKVELMITTPKISNALLNFNQILTKLILLQDFDCFSYQDS